MACEFYQKLKRINTSLSQTLPKNRRPGSTFLPIIWVQNYPHTKPDEDITHMQNKTIDQYPLWV